MFISVFPTSSNPKHTINAFISYIQICAIFVLEKNKNKQKEAGLSPLLLTNMTASSSKRYLDDLNEMAVHQELEDQPGGVVGQGELNGVRAGADLKPEHVEAEDGDRLQELLQRIHPL